MSGENIVPLIPTDSEYESDVSSMTDCSTNNPNETALTDEHLIKRLDSLLQQNRVLKIELQTYKLRLKGTQQEIKQLKHASVDMQAKAEQEEEFISNTLFKKIKELKKEKETLANNYEREEEFLTNDLSRKLQQIREEKHSLEQSLEKEQSAQIHQLMKRIQRLEAETLNKQNTLEQLKREKVDLENTLEKEQESLVNRLWKRMEKLETDKKLLQIQLQQSESKDSTENQLIESQSTTNDDAEQLKREVEKLRRDLLLTQENHRKKLEEILLQEKNARNENLHLQRKLQVEIDRRKELYRQWSESESSIEMDEERALNQKMKSYTKISSQKQKEKEKEKETSSSSSSSQQNLVRSRTASSPSFLIHRTNDQSPQHIRRIRIGSNSFEQNCQMDEH